MYNKFVLRPKTSINFTKFWKYNGVASPENEKSDDIKQSLKKYLTFHDS